MFDDLKSVMLRVLKQGTALVVVITVVGAGVGYLVAGNSGVLAALAGGLSAVGFTGLTALSFLVGAKLPLTGFLGAVMGGWFLKIVLFIVVFGLLNRAEWLTSEARPIVFFTVFAAVIGGLIIDSLIVAKARIAPSGQSS
jgi:hypothetical protein